MWRVSISDLVTAGIPSSVGWDNKANYHEPDLDPNGVHINILEFFAIFVKLWICARQLLLATSIQVATGSKPSTPAEVIPHGGHPLLVRADNTSTLSWLRYATRTKRPPVRRLAKFLTYFLCHPFITSGIHIQGKHIKGTANVSADLLSRFEKCPSWESVMANLAKFRNLQTCLIPAELLSLLVSVYLREQTVEW
jgi:hypothetical protein